MNPNYISKWKLKHVRQGSRHVALATGTGNSPALTDTNVVSSILTALYSLDEFRSFDKI